MKKLLAMLLSVLMLVSCCAVAVSAGDDDYFNDGVMQWGNDNQFNDDELDWSEYMGRFEVESAEAVAGETVVVPVSITKNPGIVSLKLDVTYDASVLELISVEAGEFAAISGEISYGPTEVNPFRINWYDALAEVENTQDGAIAYLTFKVKEDAATGNTAVTLSYNSNDVFDASLNNVEFLTVDGTIAITNPTAPAYKPGDVNNDGKVNVRDLGLMQQHINGWEVTMNLDAADVTGDGKINVRDLGLMQQYINGWDVELK